MKCCSIVKIHDLRQTPLHCKHGHFMQVRPYCNASFLNRNLSSPCCCFTRSFISSRSPLSIGDAICCACSLLCQLHGWVLHKAQPTNLLQFFMLNIHYLSMGYSKFTKTFTLLHKIYHCLDKTSNLWSYYLCQIFQPKLLFMDCRLINALVVLNFIINSPLMVHPIKCSKTKAQNFDACESTCGTTCQRGRSITRLLQEM